MSNIKPGSTNYFHLGGKIDPISEIKNAGILTSGSVFWVKDPSDNDYLEFKDNVGIDNCFDTIAAAVVKCKSDENDYVMVCPKKDGSVWDIDTSIALDKDRVHLISVGYNPNVQGVTGYSNTLRGFGTSDTSVVPTYGFLNITGNGCEVAGFRFYGTAGTALLGSVGADGGTGGLITIESDGNYIHDCAIEMNGPTWDAGGSMSLVRAGSTHSSQRFERVAFNGGTDTTCDAYVAKLPQSGANWDFIDCTFTKTGVATTNHPFLAAGGTVDGNHANFENCKFVNHLGTAPAMVIGGSMPVGALVLFKDCMAADVTTFGTGDGVKVSPSYAGGTINNLLQNPGIAIPGTALIVTKT